MKQINITLKPGIWVALGIFLLSSCEDCLLDEKSPQSEGETINVSLNIGYEPPQDAYDLLPETRTAAQQEDTGFSAELVPSSTITRSTQLVPDKLYNLEIGLYDTNGTLKKYQALSTLDAGSSFALSGVTAGTYQLVLLARGSDNLIAAGALNKSLANVRNIGVALSSIENLKADVQEDMNKMPYMLYLEKVIIADNKITNPDGTDVRLLLKRLAARVTLKWSFQLTGNSYSLKEISLQQVPKQYYPFPATGEVVGGVPTYPSMLKEYTEAYRLTDTGIPTESTCTTWVPANVRGIELKSVNATYRTKDNAPEGSMYADFRLESPGELKRIYCRIYIGGNKTNDFNVRENTDYTWNVTLKNANPTDGRVTEQSLSPAVSNNLVNTANCLMLEPGNDLCFNPYKHTAGANGWNTYLTNSSGVINTGKSIDKVKVYWQTRDAGTIGEFVLGYAVSDDNHSNMVNLQNGDDTENARIHVKAPLSQGGNAVIAAYHGNTVVWSWHIWVTDYIPKGLEGTINEIARVAAIENARAGTQKGTVHTYGGVSWTVPTGAFYNCVMMDRNLGATRAGIQSGLVDAVRTFGLLYQGMRKDPFFSTADGTPSEVNTIYDGMGRTIAGGVQKNTSSICTLDATVQNPLTFYSKIYNTNYIANWGGDDAKTLYDPCPEGWRVPSNTNINDGYTSFAAGFGSSNPAETYGGDPYKESYDKNLMYYNGTGFIELKFANRTSIASAIVGSGFMYFGGAGENSGSYSDQSAYFPAVSLRETNGNYRERASNNTVYLWSSTTGASDNFYLNHIQMQRDPNAYDSKKSGIMSTKSNTRAYGFSVRCVQDRIQKGKKPD